MKDTFCKVVILAALQLVLAPAAFGELDSLGLTAQERLWLASNPEISVAFDGYFPPYSFLNDAGELEGFSVELLRLLADKLGIEIRIHAEHEWKKLYRDAQDKKVDVVATMVDRTDRRQWFAFTKPYIFKSLVVIAREDDPAIKRREDIAGKKIALVSGYQYIPRILSEFPTVAPQYFDTMLEAMNAVSVGEADAAITFLGAGHYYRNKYLLSNLRYAAVYDARSSNESIAVDKGRPELARVLGKALASIPEASLQKLRAKWLPLDEMEDLAEIKLLDTEKLWLKYHKTIRLGVDPEFAPFEYIENGEYKGIASDYVELLRRRLGVKIEVVPGLSWKEVMARAEAQEIDVLAAVGKTSERQKYLNYTRPYLSFYRVIVAREDAPFIGGLQDLGDWSVAVQAASSHEGYLADNSDIQPVLYDTQEQALLAVASGQVDAMVGNVASVSYWIRKLNLSNLKVAAPVSADVQRLYFAVRKDWPELRSILDKGLNSISPRRRQKISEKWLAVKYEPVRDSALLWEIVGSFSLLVFLIVAWNISLSRRVRDRTSRTSYVANYDQVTGLPNRFLILDRLEQRIEDARRRGQKLVLFSVRLEGLERYCESAGRQAGDAVLRELAEQLKGRLENENNIGCLSEAQFLAFQAGGTGVESHALLGEEFMRAVGGSLEAAKQGAGLPARVGVAVFPDDGESCEQLLRGLDKNVVSDWPLSAK